MSNAKNNVSKVKILLVLALVSCGRTSEVEGIRGPKGDPGAPGANGRDGEVVYTPAPTPEPTRTPEPTLTNLPPTYPYPPIIIINNGLCYNRQCPSNHLVVCACVDNFWQTVSVSHSDLYKLKIKHYGACQSQQPTQGFDDCFSWPKPQQTPVPAPPQPTKEC